MQAAGLLGELGKRKGKIVFFNAQFQIFKMLFHLSYGQTIICGVADTSDVNKSELQRACDTGNRFCDGNPSCIRDYIVESSPYKFCPRDFDLLVSKCCWAWNTYGGTNVSGATHDCLAYCTP